MVAIIFISQYRERRWKRMERDSISERIHALEDQGFAGRTNAALDRLNRMQTNSLSNSELLERFQERAAQGLPVGKLAAALRERGIDY